MTKISANAKGALSIGIVAIIYLIDGQKLSFGTAGMPGEGFVPTLIGIGLLICCLLLFLKETVFAGQGGPSASTEADAQEEEKNTRKPLLLVIVLLLYPLLLPYLGFMLATIGLLLGCFRIFAFRNWLWSAGAAVALTLIAYVVFEKWLNVLFPRGFLG
jgi:hypothetical protein